MKTGHREAIFAQLFPTKPGKGEHTKLKIVEAAVETLGKHGIAKLTFGSVADALGMTRSHVKYHFSELDDLVDKAISYCIMNVQQLVIERLRKAHNWRQKIFAVAEAFYDWAEIRPLEASVLVFFYHSATHTKRHRELHTRMAEMGFKRFFSALEEMPSDEPSTEDFEFLSEAIWAIIDAFLLYTMTTDPRKDKRHYRKQANRAIGLLLDSALPKSQ